MQLEFHELTKAKLVDVNPRSEKRGANDLVPAVDVRLQVDTTNAALSQLDPELCEWLYKQSAQEGLPGIDAVADQTELRFPDLGFPLHWGGEGKGYSLVFDMGIDQQSGIQLHGAKLHKVTLTAKVGGTVQLAFTVSCAQDVSETDVGKLGTRVQHDVFFTLAHVVMAEEAES
jgi:hypothetical protein